ncbi:hypothetical protein HRbin37_01846 [bacterium HR37]|nr:hypothetical protein HRbin37_01846 [bacterium HR37]
MRGKALLVIVMIFLLLFLNQKGEANKPSELLEYRPTTYLKLQGIRDSLAKEYRNLRDEVVNGYILYKLQMSYEALKLKREKLKSGKHEKPPNP